MNYLLGHKEVGDLVRPGALGALAKRVRALTRAALATAPLLVRPLPPTPFNAPIHPKRDFAWVELPIAEVKAVRAALGGTINGATVTLNSPETAAARTTRTGVDGTFSFAIVLACAFFCAAVIANRAHLASSWDAASASL